MRGSKFLRVLSVLILLCLLSLPIRAELIKVGIAGHVTNVTDSYGLLQNTIHQGDSIAGYYLYDSSTPDSLPASTYEGLYVYGTAPYGMSLSVGGLTFETDFDNVDYKIGISNNYYGELYDYFGVTSSRNTPLPGGVSVDQIHWQLDQTPGTAISSDSLPLGLPDLSAWGSNQLSLMGGRYPFPSLTEKTIFQISGEVTLVYLIPEPVTITLLGLGGLAIRRSHRS
jgi:hypothetical protein